VVCEGNRDAPTSSVAASLTPFATVAGIPQILVLIGPTASGKSALAEAVAMAAGAEILSVDSMQVYRCMDVGTAKPTAVERAAVPYHGLDVVDPDQTFTTARFVELADAVISAAAARGVPLGAAGGTPLYFKALLDGLFDGPPADPAVRDRLSAEPGEALHRRLSIVDPVAAARIHANDQRRLVRALEVFDLTGRPISSFQTDWADPTPRHASVRIGLRWEKDALNRRINARVKSMLAGGWLDEVRGLLDRFGDLSPTAGEAAGYRELIEHVRGRLSLADAAEAIKIATRQLARRQMKWFRRFPDVTWLDGDRPLADNVAAVLTAWGGRPR
jgi:tRNA dimethylallyltransferase